MSEKDWMDGFRETLAEELKQKAEGEATKQESESQLRNAIRQIFDMLEADLKIAIPAFNLKVLGGARRVELRYFQNTITGDHFFVGLDGLRYAVRMKADEHKIEALGERYSPQHENMFPRQVLRGVLPSRLTVQKFFFERRTVQAQ